MADLLDKKRKDIFSKKETLGKKKDWREVIGVSDDEDVIVFHQYKKIYSRSEVVFLVCRVDEEYITVAEGHIQI